MKWNLLVLTGAVALAAAALPTSAHAGNISFGITIGTPAPPPVFVPAPPLCWPAPPRVSCAYPPAPVVYYRHYPRPVPRPVYIPPPVHRRAGIWVQPVPHPHGNGPRHPHAAPPRRGYH